MSDGDNESIHVECPISEQDIARLPRLAQIAYGTRCVQKILPLASSDSWVYSNCQQIIDHVYLLTGSEINTAAYDALDGYLRQAYQRLGFENMPSADEIKDRPRQAALCVCEAALDYLWDRYDSRNGAHNIWLSSIEAWYGYFNSRTPEIEKINREAIVNEFKALTKFAIANEWTDDTLVSNDFFLHFPSFAIEKDYPRGSIIQLTHINHAFVQKLLAFPKILYQLSPRDFEKLVAEILAGLGYEVTLTAQTRDGGHDVIAIENKVFNAMHLIECKRYSDKRKVGISAVQRLHGVVTGKMATSGILVTTSWLSPEAEKFIDEHKWQLNKRDYDGLLEWLRMYDSEMIKCSF